MAGRRRGRGFWAAVSGGVALLALLVWLGLRFASAYAACAGAEGCAGAALRAALFWGPPPRQPDEDNRFVQFLIKPPEERGEEVPEWLKERGAPPTDAGAGALDGLPAGFDPHLAKRLAEDAARRAGVLGLLRSADDAGTIPSVFGDDLDDSGLLEGAGPLAVDGVRVGALEVRGGLSRQTVGRILRRHLNELKYCHQVALQRAPALRAHRVELRFTVAASGQVVAAAVGRAARRAPGLHRCVTTAARRWLFPRPAGGGIVLVSCALELGGPR